MYWVGMDTDPRTTPEALAEFNRFYDTTHVREVVAAHPGFVSAMRYELEPELRGGAQGGPRWLAIYTLKDETAAQQYVKDNEKPWLHRRRYSPWPAARKRARTVWRLLWRQTSPSDSTTDSPETVHILGTNEPHPSEPKPLAGFELYREFAHPAPGSPRFLSVYEADPGTTHDAVWRLLYRRISPTRATADAANQRAG
jgi:hypothetical protein